MRLLFFLLPILFLFCQPSFLFGQVEIKVQNGCSFDGVLDDTDLYGFDASDEADRIVTEIMALHSLPKNFVVRAANVPNALATTDPQSKQRFILYNTTFLEKFKTDANTRWAAYFVLAHEIGHHLSGHNFGEMDPKQRKRMELEADRFAGGTLSLLGATLEEAQAGLNTFASEGESSVHPSRISRLEATASQWKTKKEWMNENGVKPKPPITLGWKIEPDSKKKGKEKVSEEPPPPKCAYCPEMVNVLASANLPDGRFYMGDNNFGPIHPVVIQTFEIGKYEVTNREFCVFLNAISPDMEKKSWEISLNGDLICRISDFSYDNGDVPNGEFTVGKDRETWPVRNVSWDGAKAYIDWLNEKLELKGGAVYRLPSESEWEYAARGGALSKGYKFSGGNTSQDVANVWDRKKEVKVDPVGRKKANELGIHDMTGNVWEWCEDCSHENYAGHPRDGSAWDDGECKTMIVRGGGYDFNYGGEYTKKGDRLSKEISTTTRSMEVPIFCSTNLGFRLARSKK